jgi:hypothetical protein
MSTGKNKDKKGKKSVKTGKKSAKTKEIPMPVSPFQVMTAEDFDPIGQREKIEKDVKSLRTYMRRLLTEDDSYKRKYTYQLTMAAQSLRLLQECYVEIMRAKAGERFTINEKSREGNGRKSKHPLISAYCQIDAVCRANLRALGMNMERLGASGLPSEGPNELMAIMRNLQSEE